jgi:UDP-glucose 4-epimerase
MLKFHLMKVLVTGGAGYIGSHTVVELATAGMEPVIADNFVNSRPEVLQRLKRILGHDVAYENVDLTDRAALARVFAKVEPDAVIHFAGLKAVGESVAEPLKYYRNNLLSTINVAELAREHGVKRLVFSSSATVYGDPEQVPIAEDARLSPTNPYGQTKVMSEQILRDAAAIWAEGSVVLLRYFNPVGAHASGLIGEDPQGEPNNLVPYVAQVAVGRLAELKVFGNDYDTADGTGVRDYLHVVDLAQAHVKALEYAGKHAGVSVFNLGTGRGNSVLEVVKAFEQASGRKVAYRVVARRPGDIATCYADPSKAERELGWKARKTLADMCADSWRWQSSNPRGYEG